VNVWAGIHGDYIIGPYFFDGKINGEEYRKFLKNDLVNLLKEVPLESRINMWIQQDGHPAHTAKATRMLLNKKFDNHWIGLRSPHEWPFSTHGRPKQLPSMKLLMNYSCSR